jgi:hypothetical protein
MQFEGILNYFKNARGGVNMLVLIVAFILSIMIIYTRNQCTPGTNDQQTKYYSDVKIPYWIAILLVVLTCLLFAFDLGIMASSKK